VCILKYFVRRQGNVFVRMKAWAAMGFVDTTEKWDF